MYRVLSLVIARSIFSYCLGVCSSLRLTQCALYHVLIISYCVRYSFFYTELHPVPVRWACMCQKRPSMCQKRPSMCQKRPSMCLLYLYAGRATRLVLLSLPPLSSSSLFLLSLPPLSSSSLFLLSLPPLSSSLSSINLCFPLPLSSSPPADHPPTPLLNKEPEAKCCSAPSDNNQRWKYQRAPERERARYWEFSITGGTAGVRS